MATKKTNDTIRNAACPSCRNTVSHDVQTVRNGVPILQCRSCGGSHYPSQINTAEAQINSRLRDTESELAQQVQAN